MEIAQTSTYRPAHRGSAGRSRRSTISHSSSTVRSVVVQRPREGGDIRPATRVSGGRAGGGADSPGPVRSGEIEGAGRAALFAGRPTRCAKCSASQRLRQRATSRAAAAAFDKVPDIGAQFRAMRRQQLRDRGGEGRERVNPTQSARIRPEGGRAAIRIRTRTSRLGVAQLANNQTTRRRWRRLKPRTTRRWPIRRSRYRRR